MSRIHPRAGRAGFTLIELLVVIAIIGILMGLTLPAVQKIRASMNRARQINELAQMSSSIEAFKSTYGADHVPGSFRLRPDYTALGLNSYEAVFLKKTFGNRMPLTSTGLPTLDLNGNQCLVFFLGGHPNIGLGFSTSKTNPFGAGGDRNGPFYDSFTPNRMGSPINGYVQFLDIWGTPLFYASSRNGNDYSSFSYTNQQQNPLEESPGKFVNSHGYQLISAGPNRVFGGGGVWSPGSGTYTPGGPGGDDLGQFNGGPLSVRR